MLSGWAYFRDKMPFCKKNVAKEGSGRIFEVGVFSRDYGNNINPYGGSIVPGVKGKILFAYTIQY